MREFKDEAGKTWVAQLQERPGDDYKGRFLLVIAPEGESPRDGFPVDDVRWNSVKTAERTLETMSDKELRRRLRIALGRGMGRLVVP